MPEVIYTVTTSWKKLKNYDKNSVDHLITRISKFDKNIYAKFLNKESSVIFKGADRAKAIKVKSLLANVGIYAVVDEPAIPSNNTKSGNRLKTIEKQNFNLDLITKGVFKYTRLVLIFPVLLLAKFSKKEISTKNAFIILTIMAMFGLYNLILDVLMKPFYDLSYDYCANSFISIETIFIIASIAKNITSISVASLTGISEFISRISAFLENGLIALTAQTVLLKILQQGFLIKSGFTLGFGFGIFEASRKFGEKIVFFTIFIYISLPFFVAAETYIFDQITTQQIKTINKEYDKHGGAVGLSKKAAVGLASYLYNKVNDFISGKSEKLKLQRKRKRILKIFFFMTIFKRHNVCSSFQS